MTKVIKELGGEWVDAESVSTSVGFEGADFITTGSNDSSVIQQAIDTGGIVNILPGTYEIDAELSVGDNTVIVGSGCGTILKLKDNTDEHVVSVNGANITIKDIAIDGNKDNQATAYHNCINVTGSREVTISNCCLYNATKNCIQTDTTVFSTIENNQIHDSGNDGVVLFDQTRNTNVIGNHMINTGNQAVHVYKDAHYNNVSDNQIVNPRSQGVFIGNGAATPKACNYNIVKGNIIHLSSIGVDGIVVRSGSSFNLVSSNQIIVRYEGARAIRVYDFDGLITKNNTVEHNQISYPTAFTTPTDYAIRIAGENNISRYNVLELEGNVTDGILGNGVNVDINNEKVVDAINSGIRLDASCTGEVVNNTISGSTKYTNSSSIQTKAYKLEND